VQRLKIHPDFSEFVEALGKNGVEFVIVGSFALAFHGYPRATEDIDFWIRPTEGNSEALLKALIDFGFRGLEVSKEDILTGKIIQLGYPPVRIDLITVLDGLRAEEVWDLREKGESGLHDVCYLGKKAYIRNKRATGITKISQTSTFWVKYRRRDDVVILLP
jgi:hypothetical protein